MGKLGKSELELIEDMLDRWRAVLGLVHAHRQTVAVLAACRAQGHRTPTLESAKESLDELHRRLLEVAQKEAKGKGAKEELKRLAKGEGPKKGKGAKEEPKRLAKGEGPKKGKGAKEEPKRLAKGAEGPSVTLLRSDPWVGQFVLTFDHLLWKHAATQDRVALYQDLSRALRLVGPATSPSGLRPRLSQDPEDIAARVAGGAFSASDRTACARALKRALESTCTPRGRRSLLEGERPSLPYLFLHELGLGDAGTLQNRGRAYMRRDLQRLRSLEARLRSLQEAPAPLLTGFVVPGLPAKRPRDSTLRGWLLQG